MKKDSFTNGAFIATLCIVISRFLGLLYVIPFYAIIGESGGALYTYAYNIYQIFLAISSAGIPLAISKMVSEYETLGLNEAKERTYRLAIRIVGIISILAFVILMIFAPNIAHLIIGNNVGGNTIEDIALVVRSISFAILIVPFLSVTKGYLQGHKYISVSSYSEVIEQVLRIAVILFGSYFTLKVLNLSQTGAVAVAVFGAFVGALGAFIYLKRIMNKNKSVLMPKDQKVDKVTNKEIIKKIIFYALPFVIVSITSEIYNFVDTVVVLRTLIEKLNFSVEVAETIIGSYTTWSGKFRMIIISLSFGIATSLLPNIVNAFVKKDNKELNNTFNKAIQLLFYVGLPVTILISLFSKEVWYLFYGESLYGPNILSFSIFIGLAIALNNTVSSALQGVNKFKWVYITAALGVVINAGLDYPLMLLMDKVGIYPYYGGILASLIGYTTASLLVLYKLKKDFGLNYKDTCTTLLKMLLASVIMIFVALGLKFLVPYELGSKFICVLVLILYFGISLIAYLFICKKLKINKKLLDNISALKKLSFLR